MILLFYSLFKVCEVKFVPSNNNNDNVIGLREKRGQKR